MTFLDAAAVRILETNDPFGILQTLCSSTVCCCPASLALSQCLTMWKNVNFCPVIVSFTSSLPIYHGTFELVMIRRTVIEKKFRGKNQKSFYSQHPSTKETAHLREKMKKNSSQVGIWLNDLNFHPSVTLSQCAVKSWIHAAGIQPIHIHIHKNRPIK